MAETKIFPQGITFFAPREKAPTWVKGSVIINMRELVDWVTSNPSVLVEHEKYGKQLKLTVTDKGMQVDTWKPTTGHKDFQPSKETPKGQIPDQDFSEPLPF